MRTWDDFYPLVLPYVPGCSNPAVDFQLMLAAREFLKRTLVWRVDLDAVPTVAGQVAYDFALDSSRELVQLMGATLDGDQLSLVTLAKAQTLDTNGLLENGTTGVYALDRRRFAITATPTLAGLSIVPTVTLVPSLTAQGVDDDVFADHAEAIAHLALSKLLLQPGQPWRDAQAAAVYFGQYDEAAEFAAQTADRQFTHVKPHRTGKTFL